MGEIAFNDAFANGLCRCQRLDLGRKRPNVLRPFDRIFERPSRSHSTSHNALMRAPAS